MRCVMTRVHNRNTHTQLSVVKVLCYLYILREKMDLVIIHRMSKNVRVTNVRIPVEVCYLRIALTTVKYSNKTCEVGVKRRKVQTEL